MNDLEILMLKHAARHLLSHGLVKEGMDLSNILQQLWQRIRGLLGMNQTTSVGDWAGQMTGLRDLSDRLNTRYISYYEDTPPPTAESVTNPYLS